MVQHRCKAIALPEEREAACPASPACPCIPRIPRIPDGPQHVLRGAYVKRSRTGQRSSRTTAHVDSTHTDSGKNQTVRRRFELRSRVAFMDEQPNRASRIQLAVATIQHRSTLVVKRCELGTQISLLSPAYFVSQEEKRQDEGRNREVGEGESLAGGEGGRAHGLGSEGGELQGNAEDGSRRG